jgi:hypothetical protein
MQKITSVTELKDAILQLEDKQASDLLLLKDQFSIFRESMAPANLIRRIFKEVFATSNIVKTLLSAAVGLTTGYLTKRYFTGLTGSVLKKLLNRFL